MSHVNVDVYFDPSTGAITFSGDHVLPLDNGVRAAIGVPDEDPEKKIALTLRTEGLSYPKDPEDAVTWQSPDKKKPSWVDGIHYLDDARTELEIDDWWKPSDSTRIAKFTLTVVYDGSNYKSPDPTIINNPHNK